MFSAIRAGEFTLRPMAQDPDSYAAIADIYDHWCEEVTEDLGFYVAACEGAGGPVIEIGVGTGRIAIPLAVAGHRVIGIDRSAPMLAQLADRAAAAGVTIETHAADLRDLPALPPADRVLAPFRVLLHLATDAERLAFLERARELLVPGGRLVFDVFEPTPGDVKMTQRRWMTRDSGVREFPSWDVAAGTLDLTVRFRGRETTMHLSYIPGDRWRELLDEAGLHVIAAYEGFEGRRFRGRPGDSAWIAERPLRSPA
jgi:SAM-dependent methyltransferase